MNNKKKKIIIASLLGMVVCLGIGFAAFSTTLKINGSAKVSPNGENYKVFFVSDVRSTTDYDIEPVDAISTPDNIEYEKGIISEETNFTNTSVTFTEDGQSIDYKFYILNAGKYDAHFINLDIGNKTCTPGEDADPTLAASACDSINLSVILGDEGKQTTYTTSTAITDHVLPKGTWEQIIVRITYPDGSPLVDGELEVRWEDIEITTATTTTYTPEPTIIPTEIIEGDINTTGSEVAVDEEHFYVLGTNKDDSSKVDLLAKYNLMVGYVYYFSAMKTVEINHDAEGYNLQYPQSATSEYYALIPFSYDSYWDSGEDWRKSQLKPEYGTDYGEAPYVYDENSNLYPYMQKYKQILENNYNITIDEIRLLSLEEIIELGSCTYTNPSYTCDTDNNNRQWLKSTYYWLGNASQIDGIWSIVGTQIKRITPYSDTSVGLRPVITVSKKDFKKITN